MPNTIYRGRQETPYREVGQMAKRKREEELEESNLDSIGDSGLEWAVAVLVVILAVGFFTM